MKSLCLRVLFLPSLSVARLAFIQQPSGARMKTTLHLEDWVAEMIDAEIYRQDHKDEFEHEWMEKNRGAMLHAIHKVPRSKKRPTGGGNKSDEFVSNLMLDDGELRQKAKDRRMAKVDPQRYCADRCIASGNCDVYEDMFDLAPKEVLQFCSDCVLGEGEEPCEIPDAFYEKLSP